MKKLFSALFIVMMIALACTLVAGAAETYTPNADGLYNIEYAVTNADDGTQFGMVVIEATGDEAFKLDESTIRYIDQVGAAGEKITFDAFAPMDLQKKGTYKVYIGGGELDEATFIGTLSVSEGGGGTDPDEPGTDPDEPGTDPEVPQGILGDINGDGVKNANDAVFLLRHVGLPVLYPTSYAGTKDFNKDGAVSAADAVYLLRHVGLPALYPINW